MEGRDPPRGGRLLRRIALSVILTGGVLPILALSTGCSADDGVVRAHADEAPLVAERRERERLERAPTRSACPAMTPDARRVDTDGLRFYATRPVAVIDAEASVPAAAYNLEARGLDRVVRRLEKSAVEAYARQTLRRVIRTCLIWRELARHDIEVADEEVDARMRAFHARFGDRRGVENFYESAGITRAHRRREFRIELGIDRLLERRGELRVDTEAVRAHFQKYHFKFQEPARVHLRAVVVPRPSHPSVEEQERLEARLDAIREDLADEEIPFEEVARRHGDTETDESAGGDRGWVVYDELPEEIARAARHLELTETSEAIRTEHAYYFIEVLGRRPARPQTFEEVRGEIRARLERRARERARARWIDEITRRARVEHRTGAIVVEGDQLEERHSRR